MRVDFLEAEPCRVPFDAGCKRIRVPLHAMDDHLALLFAASSVTAGVILQRITGLGFSSVSAPVLILVLGPVAGVQAVNALAALCALLLLAPIWRDVELRRTAVLAAAALAGTPIGVALAFRINPYLLQVIIGLTMLIALFTASALSRLRLVSGTPGALTAGVLGGISNALSGQAGPLMGAYAMASRWDMPRYVASMQLCWFLVNTGTVALKGLPPIGLTASLVLAAAVVVGGIAGPLIAKRVSARLAERWLLAVALVGSILVLGKGIAGLL